MARERAGERARRQAIADIEGQRECPLEDERVRIRFDLFQLTVRASRTG